VEIRELVADQRSNRGYLVVIVPKSPRAPHQVATKGDLRFYGRGAKGNRTLTQEEVARLYREREQYEQDADALLQERVQLAPFPPDDQLGYMHAFARPVILLDEDAWDRAAQDGTEELLEKLREAASPPNPGFDPALHGVSEWRRRGAHVWTLDKGGDRPENTVRCDINIDGRGSLFCGRAADIYRNDELFLIEQLIAGNLGSFLSIMGELYERAGYRGPVDIGVAITGIEGAQSYLIVALHGYSVRTYDAEGYYSTARVSAGELEGGTSVARKLVQRLVDASVGEGIDPLERLS
jgi:hypothetical protein